MATIRFKNITKKYGKTTAINSVDFTINDKEFMVFVGPSGCGKSTLLRMIAGLEDITSGELYIDDIVVNDLPPKDRDIAIVFQNYALYPHMTAYENLAFGLKIRKMDKTVIHKKVMDAAAILEIESLLDRKPSAMSGGQRQRIAIGRAIVRDPKVFLFDEPLSNLDAKLRSQMRLEIAKLHKRLKTTIVFVTHDQVEAMTLGDRMAVINHGIIQQIGTPAHIYKYPINRFVAQFIGSPAMNFIAGSLYRNDQETYFENEAKTMIYPLPRMDSKGHDLVQKVLLGIRPEHLYASPKNDTNLIFQAEIQHVEQTGFECFVVGRVYDSAMTARFTADELATIPTERMIWYADPSHLHFFDAESGERI